MICLAAYGCADSGRSPNPCGESAIETTGGCLDVGAIHADLPTWAVNPACKETEIPTPEGACLTPGPQVCSGILPPSATGGVRLVDPAGTWASRAVEIGISSRHGTIQEAIDAAAEGDTVLIGRGDFQENLKITKRIMLTGGCVSAMPMVGAKDSTKAVLTIAAKGVRMSNLALQGGTVGVQVERGAGVTVEDATFMDNVGEAVDSQGDLTVVRSIVRGTYVTRAQDGYEGGARGLRAVSEMEQINVRIEDNLIEGVKGDGIYIIATSGIARRNLITGLQDCCKETGATSAGIWISRSEGIPQGEIRVENNVLRNNRIWTGIGVKRDTPAIVRNNVIATLGTALDRETVVYQDQTESIGIKMKGGTPLVEGNFVSDVAGRALMLTSQAAAGESVIRNNYFEKCDSHCVYAFGPGASYAFQNNMILRAGRPSSHGIYDIAGGLWLTFGTFRLERNTVADSYLVGVGMLNSNVTLERNIVRGVRLGTFQLGPSGVVAKTGDGLAALAESQLEGVRNLFHGNQRGGVLLDTGGVIGYPNVSGVKATLRENAFTDIGDFAVFVQNGAKADIGAEGVRTTIRGTPTGVAATPDSLDGVRLIGSDAGVRLAVRDQPVDAVRLSIEEFGSGVRLLEHR